MEITIFLAQLLGFFLTITGLSMILKREMMLEVFSRLFSDRLLSYLLGVFILAFGLVVVLLNPGWDTGLDIVISVIGWYMILESLGYLFLPAELIKSFTSLLKEERYYFLITIPYLILGFFLLGASLF